MRQYDFLVYGPDKRARLTVNTVTQAMARGETIIAMSSEGVVLGTVNEVSVSGSVANFASI